MCFHVSRSRYLCKEIKTLLRVEKEKPLAASEDSSSAITSRPNTSYPLKEAGGHSELPHRFVQERPAAASSHKEPSFAQTVLAYLGI